MKNLKIGDKISLINRSRIKDEAKIIGFVNNWACLYFKNWNMGHNGKPCPNYIPESRSCWFYDIKELSERKDVKILSQQLEFDFNEKI